MKNIIWTACIILCACKQEKPEKPPDVAREKTSGPVVFIGDSITQYFPTADYLPGSINVGIHSQTSAMMLERLNSDVLQHHPSVVVILAGTNDILRTQNPSTYSISAMADKARAEGARVILCTLPPNEEYLYGDSVDSAEGRVAFARFNEELRLLAGGYQYDLADYYSAMVLADGTQNPDLFKYDHQHPSPAGYDVMWKVVGPLITQP